MKHSGEFSLFGIFGYPLVHTLSPVMQEAAFEKLGNRAFYLPFELEPRTFRKVMRSLRRLLLDGFNVTVPYKEEVVRYLDGLTPEAKAIGAVNTVFPSGRRWLGANTDSIGFIESVRGAGFKPQGKNVLVLGAGGSARAVVYGLAKAKARAITLVNRHRDRALRVATRFRPLFPKTDFQVLPLSEADFSQLLRGSDVVVNTTSVGLEAADKSLIPKAAVPKAGTRRIFFVDLIYRPEETAFLRQARLRGHRTLNGVDMLALQGAKSFEYWTGREAPVNEMRKALNKTLNSKESKI